MLRKRTFLLGLGLLTSTILATSGGGAMHGYNGCYNEGGTFQGLDRCPQPVPRGASCVAYGILLTEQDASGLVGDVSNDWSESRAWTLPVNSDKPPMFPPPRGQIAPPPFPDPPTDPQAHADAEQVGVTYNHFGLGLGLDASAVFSRCDVAAVQTFDGLFYTEAYGRAGVADFELSVPSLGLAVNAEALDFEIHAYGTPDVTYAFEACDIVQLGASPIPGMTVSYCPPPNSGVAAGPLIVELHEVWGPIPNAAGQWVYGGAALHLTLTVGASVVDVYVGYVAVAVTGGPPMPPTWVIDPFIGPGPMPCLPAPCQP